MKENIILESFFSENKRKKRAHKQYKNTEIPIGKKNETKRKEKKRLFIFFLCSYLVGLT